MKKNSIWSNNNYTNYNELSNDLDADVLIIGGGITGVSTLYHLRNSDLKVALVEQNKIAMSTTSKSTGKLTFLQNDLIDKIRDKYDDDKALEYLSSQIDAIKSIVEVIKSEKIKCDLEKVDSYLYTNKVSEIDKIKSLEKFLNKNNIKTFHNSNNLVKSKYMINVKDTYVFNPVKFIYGLLKNNKYPIYENTSIRDIKYEDNYYICKTNKNIIKTKYVVLASHYPYFLIPYMFPFKVSLEKSYLSASKYKSNSFSLISYSNPFISIRIYKDYLIYLSNSHSIDMDVCDKDNYNELLKKVHDLGITPEYIWSNIDIITCDGLPIIGKLSKNMLIGTGYNTWGLGNGFLAGKILSDLIKKKKNSYEKLFDPNRLSLKLPSNILKNIDGYVKGYLKGSKYICPHLGCKLIYNEIDKTFDCPCHGSRFDESGKCISAPANKDIEIK